MTADPDWIIHRYDLVTSTMDVAETLARAGARDRGAVFSNGQTAGRGRAGRSWHSPPGTALSTTLLLRPAIAPQCLPLLSLVTAVAVAETIEAMTGAIVRLKWPNDVWLGTVARHQKAAGILLSSNVSSGRVNHVLIGIGLNVSATGDDLPPGATSLLQASGVRTTAWEFARNLLGYFDTGYAAYLQADGRPSLAGWMARAALLGEAVTILDGERRFTGIHAGIDEDGALLLRAADGNLQRFMAGDLLRGPRRIAYAE